MTAPIEFHDVQGNILNGYGLDHVAYLGVEASSTAAAQECLGQVVDKVTTAELVPTRERRPHATLNVAITYTGFVRLGLPPQLLARFPAAFREPIAKRAKRVLGDIGASHPDRWTKSLGTGNVHLMLSVNARTKDELTIERNRLRDMVDAREGLTILHDEDAAVMPKMREHFGYADGFAQPDIEGVARPSRKRADSRRGDGVPLDDLGWRPLNVGEFLLGYPDEDDQVATDPDPDLVRNGTYVVFRRLYQDVARFRQGLLEAAKQSGLSKEFIAAKIVGRWRDGLPIELNPDDRNEDDLEEVDEPDPSNDFRYLPHDRLGYICPIGAHIRRANPRDAFGFGGRLTARHRIIRRGMPYGTPLAADAENDGDDRRGLLFVCFNADIERQFETVQQQWINDGDAFGLGDDRDYILGDSSKTGKMTVPINGCAPRFINALPEVVQTRGTEYLFAPGIRALHRLAAGWDT